MDLTKIEDLQLAMQLAKIKPKKGLGQHFLIDRDSVDKIVSSASISPGDTVLEIGPGLGVMTYRLCERAKQVVAVETDPVMVDLLNRDKPKNLKVVDKDILRFDFRSLPRGYKVAANIPYYLTSKIFRLLLENPNPPSAMTLLIQKEVAERVVAKPGDLSVLALSVQYFAKPEITGVVEKHKFWPPPKVDSAILRAELREKTAFEADPAKLFRLIKAGFGERRKQLKNSLAGGLNCEVPVIEKVLRSARIDPASRAQELSMAEWRRLYVATESNRLLG
jgi:16S rRNA (adenine1518-N6/adenine1519-N6)-dimethyltransferase